MYKACRVVKNSFLGASVSTKIQGPIRVYINMDFFTFCRDVSMQGCAEMFFHSYRSRKIHFPSNSSDERRILKICACCTTMSTWIFILRFAQRCIFYCCIHARSVEEGMQERTTCVGTSSQIYGSQLRYWYATTSIWSWNWIKLEEEWFYILENSNSNTFTDLDAKANHWKLCWMNNFISWVGNIEASSEVRKETDKKT